MRQRYQGGAISLLWLAVLMAAFAAIAMAALFSMRYDRNFFAEAWDRLVKAPAVTQLAPLQPPANGPAAALRKCVIDGKTVISNVDCKQRGRAIELHDSRGIDAPKAPPAPAEAAPATMQEKIIENATR